MGLLKIIKVFFLIIYTVIVDAKQTNKIYKKLENIMKQSSDEALCTAAKKFAKVHNTTETYALNLMTSVIADMGITAEELEIINQKLKELNNIE